MLITESLNWKFFVNRISIMAFVGQLDKGETRLLTLIAEHLANIGELDHAIAVHKKMGDFKNLALVYIKAKQWNEVRNSSASTLC